MAKALKSINQRLFILPLLFCVGTQARLEAQNLSFDNPPYELVWGDGNVDNKVNLVFVGDGYTKNEMAEFRERVSACISEIFSNYEPFAFLREYFNCWTIHALSVESGSGFSRNTAFQVRGRDVQNWRNLRIASNITPADENIFCALLLNGVNVRGKSFPVSGVALMGGDGSFLTEVVVHELLGHLLGGLRDEYGTGAGNPDPEARRAVGIPNWSTEPDPNFIKWSRFLGYEGVGIYERCVGGAYGIYRPVPGEPIPKSSQSHPSFDPYGYATCFMNGSGSGPYFCLVCRNAIVRSIEVRVGKSLNPSMPGKPPNPRGPDQVEPLRRYSYTVGPSRDDDGHLIRYTIDWGDGTSSISPFLRSNSEWTAEHIWKSPNSNYSLRVSATDALAGYSAWSDSLSITAGNNYPPAKPTLSFPEIAYTQEEVEIRLKADDSEGDRVQFTVVTDEGESKTTSWVASGEEVIIHHTWTSANPGLRRVYVSCADQSGGWYN